MTISELVDLGLEVATARDAAPGRVLAVAGVVLAGAAALGVASRSKYLPGLSYGMSGGPWPISWGPRPSGRRTPDEIREENEERQRRLRREADEFGVPGPGVGKDYYTFEISAFDNRGKCRVLATPTILAVSLAAAEQQAESIAQQLTSNDITLNYGSAMCVKPPCVLPRWDFEVRKES